jgi:hypothetical protein
MYTWGSLATARDRSGPMHSKLPPQGRFNTTLIQPGSGKSVNYWGLFSFELAFTWCKLISPSIRRVCNRALQFWESGRMVWQHYCTEKEQETSPNENPPPSALYMAHEQELIGMLTGAAQHCGPWSERTSPSLGWSVKAVKLVGSGEVGRVAF